MSPKNGKSNVVAWSSSQRRQIFGRRHTMDLNMTMAIVCFIDPEVISFYPPVCGFSLGIDTIRQA
jgi:hypothetical protein